MNYICRREKKCEISRFFPFPQNCSRTFNRKNEHGKNKKKNLRQSCEKAKFLQKKKDLTFFMCKRLTVNFANGMRNFSKDFILLKIRWKS